MKVENLRKVRLASKNGHVLFNGNIDDVPKEFKDFEAQPINNFRTGQFEGDYFLNCWVSVTYDDNGKKVITIQEQ